MNSAAGTSAATLVRQFREIVLWPLQLAPSHTQRPWELLPATGPDQPWHKVEDRFGDPSRFRERDFAEFAVFLPYVQRMLYGEGAQASPEHRESPIRMYGRNDIARVRVTLSPGSVVELDVPRVRLYFFSDIDVVIPVIELEGEDLDLELVKDLLFRFGRAYSIAWQADGTASRCPLAVEWISQSGQVLARSDYENRSRYLATVARSRTPCIASHWEWLLRPMVPDYAEEPGALRYRQLEYYRMPLMSYLALDDPAALTRTDFISLGLVTGPAEGGELPFSAESLAHFEDEVCYDRFWAPQEEHAWSNTRFLCSGHSFLMIGRQSDRFFTDADTGLLSQFRRHQFILGLIAHFHKAALLMLSDRLVVALNRLDIRDVESIKRFKRQIRRALETFLRFTHRYWFHEVSTQDQARALFQMWTRHLGTERLYTEVREEIQDMSDYLNSDSLRRQANTVVRLTVVTTLGLIGTIATGVLGMNIFAHADETWYMKAVIFLAVLIPTLALTFYTVSRSKVLADFLDRVSESQGRRPPEAERRSTHLRPTDPAPPE